jgi:hypothetical protein
LLACRNRKLCSTTASRLKIIRPSAGNTSWRAPGIHQGERRGKRRALAQPVRSGRIIRHFAQQGFCDRRGSRSGRTHRAFLRRPQTGHQDRRRAACCSGCKEPLGDKRKRLKQQSISGYLTDLPVGQKPVQPHLQKYSDFPKPQITAIFPTVSSHSRGVSRSSWTRDGMRWTLIVPLTNGTKADGEVVWS